MSVPAGISKEQSLNLMVSIFESGFFLSLGKTEQSHISVASLMTSTLTTSCTVFVGIVVLFLFGKSTW